MLTRERWRPVEKREYGEVCYPLAAINAFGKMLPSSIDERAFFDKYNDRFDWQED